MKRKALLMVFSLANLLLMGLIPSTAYTPQSTHDTTFVNASSTTTTDIGVYGEFSNLYIGKQGKGIYTLAVLGGNIEIPMNDEWNGTFDLEAMHLGAGIGHRWWLYYHRDIFPDIPPAISLSLVYDLPEEQAIEQANKLMPYLQDALGVELAPFWSEKNENGDTVVAFASAFELNETTTFMDSEILARFPDGGQSAFLDSSVIDSNLDNGRYTRASLSIKRDKRDIDDDGITQEFVPILFFGTVIHRSFIQESGDWYTFSVKDALGTPDETTIESNTNADLSLFEIKFPIPIEVDRTQTTLPDNPMFEYKGKMVYHLKAGDDTASYDDITVTFNMLNIRKELNTMPIVTGGFFIGDGGRPYVYNEDEKILASDIPFITTLSNIQNETRTEATAESVQVFLPLPAHFIDRIEFMKDWYYKQTGENLTYRDFVSTGDHWNFATFTIDRKQHYGLKGQIDSIPAGDNVTLTFNLTIFPNSLFKVFGGNDWFYIYFQMGPLFCFHDSNGRRYSGFANGFAFIMRKIGQWPDVRWNSSATVGVTMPTRGTMVDEQELKMRFNFTVGILSFGTNAIENVTVDLFRARSKGYYGYQRPVKVASEKFDQVKLNDIILANMNFTERLKVGQWLAFSRIKYDVFGAEDITFFTNSFSMYVPPVQWLTERWRTNQEYPYPHVRLSLEKDAFLNQTSNRLHIQVNVTHEGSPDEAPTTGITVYERILTEYVNTSEGTNGIVDVRVNGDSIMGTGKVHIGVKEDLGVVWVRIGPLRLEPGETKRIEIVVATKDTVSEVSLHGTIVKYNFGKFKPEEKEDIEDAMGAENESEESTAQSLKVELASIYTQKKEDNTVSTSSNTVPLVQVLAPEPGGETPLPNEGVLFIASIALVVALLASTVYYIAKRKRKTQLSV